MGAGAGHMLSPWEKLDLKFSEIVDIVNKSLDGQLKNVSEKLDGQNMMITFKNNNVYLARSKKQMKNGGKLAVIWNDVRSHMHQRTPEYVKDEYENAMSDLQTIFSNSELDLNEIFKAGYMWLNIEWINPKAINIIPYNKRLVAIHSINQMNDNGDVLDTDQNSEFFNNITNDFEKSQISSKITYTHEIRKTNSVSFDKIICIDIIKPDILDKIQSAMDRTNLCYDDTIGDYLCSELSSWLSPNIDDIDLIESLIRRWVYNDKSTSITKLLKDKDDSLVTWIKYNDKKIDRRIGKFLDPIIEVFSRASIAVLQNVSDITVSNMNLTESLIRRKSEDAIKKANQFITGHNMADLKIFEKKKDYLETQLRRLKQAGGLEGIAPIEGIVFEYKDNLFKFSGNYLPLLKIINFFEFGKDK